MKLRLLDKTCDACPAQWEGETEDGRDIYIRYRWGYLSVTLNPWTEDSEEIFVRQIGGEYDGSMGTKEMLELTGLEW